MEAPPRHENQFIPQIPYLCSLLFNCLTVPEPASRLRPAISPFAEEKKLLFTTLQICVVYVSMKLTTLIYSVLISTLCLSWNGAWAQTAASSAAPPASLPAAPPAKRSFNPEAIKRAKLTRLRKDVALTDEQITKVKPLIDAYVNDLQAVKNDASLDSHTKRQKLSELRHKYDTDLDGVLNPEQQQKLVSIKEERRARLRAARTSKGSTPLEPSGSPGVPAIVQ
jgi:Spy/CpxP family protein refolding chaperone